VHLVDDENLIPEAEEAKPGIIGAQAGEESLVNGANAGRGEQRAL
jgi:hypothetical protein